MPAAKRAVLLGLDALVPNTLQRFMDDGALPHFAALRERGAFSRIRPVIPAQTPTNWNTLATGATPGTHGVVQWGSHRPGEPLREFHRAEAFNAGLCRAEYLWETAARAGRTSVVMNYAGYPPTTVKATHIDWLFRPARSYFDLAPPTLYHNCPDLDTTDPIAFRPAVNWANLPPSDPPPLETVIQVAPATRGAGPRYHAILTGESGCYTTLRIAADKDADAALATLAEGQWSDWLRAPFETDDQADAIGAFRFKLIELAPDASRVQLYRSDAFPADGRFCSNPAVAEQLVQTLGPYVHAGMTCALHCRGWLDWETVDETLADEARWWSQAARLAMDETDASLLVLHWHILDAMGHRFVAFTDPTSSQYREDLADEAWDIVRAYYRAADRFLGAFLDQLDDGETVFAVVSDHGMPANKKAVSLINAFKDRGWIALTEDGQDVDWPRSKLFWSQNHLWINLKGRDPGGIVPARDYQGLRAEVMAAMRDLKDPDTGEHVVPLVLPREDASMVGLWGDYIGDVVFCYAGGCRWSGPEVLRMDEERTVFPCGGGNHGPMLPTYETEATSVMGTLLLAGPGIRPCETAPTLEQFRISTPDLAPTLAHLIGLDAPAQNEGRVLHEFLRDAHAERPARTLQPTERSLLHRPTVKPRPIQLQGDVTDEET